MTQFVTQANLQSIDRFRAMFELHVVTSAVSNDNVIYHSSIQNGYKYACGKREIIVRPTVAGDCIHVRSDLNGGEIVPPCDFSRLITGMFSYLVGETA